MRGLLQILLGKERDTAKCSSGGSRGSASRNDLSTQEGTVLILTWQRTARPANMHRVTPLTGLRY